MSKPDDPIFLHQPVIGAGEDDLFNNVLANWGTVNKWLRSKPGLTTLKKSALYEAEDKARVVILDRLLTRIFQLEKAEAMKRLTLLKK